MEYLFGFEPYAARYDWKEGADGTFHFSLETNILNYKVDMTVQPDNSGVIEYYLDDELAAKASWNAAGTAGTYEVYEDGELTDSFTWES